MKIHTPGLDPGGTATSTRETDRHRAGYGHPGRDCRVETGLRFGYSIEVSQPRTD